MQKRTDRQVTLGTPRSLGSLANCLLSTQGIPLPCSRVGRASLSFGELNACYRINPSAKSKRVSRWLSIGAVSPQRADTYPVLTKTGGHLPLPNSWPNG